MNPGPHLAPAVILAQLGERREELIARCLPSNGLRAMSTRYFWRIDSDRKHRRALA